MDHPDLGILPVDEQLTLVQIALHKAFNAEYGPLILEQNDLDQIHESVMQMHTDITQSLSLSQKWEDKSQIPPPEHLQRYPFPEEMEETVCLYLFEEGFQGISQHGKDGYRVQKGTTYFDLEATIFEALDQQCIVYNIEAETLENMKKAIVKRHNDFINAQQNLDQRLRDFSTDNLAPC
jgi:hypothetical protein